MTFPRTLVALALLALAPAAHADRLINVGNHVLQPDTPGQTIDLFVTGGDPVAGLNLYVIVGDGSAGPTITDIDVLTGTIFGAVANFGQFDLGSSSTREWAWGTVISGTGTIAGSGKIATLTVDTTGLFAGAWDLTLDDGSANFGITDFADGELVNITQGSLSIIPEPATAALALLGLAALAPRRRHA